MTDIEHKDGTVTRKGVRYGCHADCANDQEIDGCVVDEDRHMDCIYGVLASGRLRRSKWTCSEWRKLPKHEQKRREALEGDQ
jgi:hypothetical protein